MPRIILVRHAESEANVGIHHDHGPETKLTSNGISQAKNLCPFLDPSFKIISSHFHRAQHTATISTNHFHDNSIDTWEEIGEFMDVNHLDMIDGEEIGDDRARLNFFWNKMDPNYKFNGNSESFRDFADRAREALLKIKTINQDTYIFSHGYVIRIIRMYLHGYLNWAEVKSGFANEDDFYKQLMIDFWNYYDKHPEEPRMGNCNQYEITDLVNRFVG
jgi:broad specificity phosphatase PhoE